MSTVSVITTAYNVASFLGSAIDSVLKQSFSDWNLIVVDDASTDDTLRIARSFHDPRIRVISEGKLGPVGALNRGLIEARGRFVAFLDGDDMWASLNLERQLAALHANPQAPMSFARSRVIDEEGLDWGPMSRAPRALVGRAELFEENFCANGSSVLLRSSALENLGGFDPTFPACYDLDFWMRVAGAESKMLCVPEFLIFYRRRRGQMSGSWARMQAGWNMLRQKWLQVDPQLVKQHRAEANRNMSRYLSLLAIEAGEPLPAFRFLAQSFSQSPMGFLSDPRSGLVLAGLLAKTLLPAPAAAELERRIRSARN